MTHVSIFKNFSKVIENKPVTLVLEAIKDGTYKKQVEDLRLYLQQENKEEYDLKKKSLPAFTPAGQFSHGRKLKHLVEYTSFLVLDLDKIEVQKLQECKTLASKDSNTFAAFISPSGNGLKILVKLQNSQIDKHKQAFKEVKAYYEQLLKVKVDESGSDITRLCFMSWDEDLYLNDSAEAFPIIQNGLNIADNETELPSNRLSGVAKDKNLGRSALIIEEFTSEAIYQKCVELTNRKQSFSEGSRNAFVYQLACNLNRQGLAQEQALSFITSDYNYNDQEVLASVKSAFSNTNEFGAAKQQKMLNSATKTNQSPTYERNRKSYMQPLSMEVPNNGEAQSHVNSSSLISIEKGENDSPAAFIDRIEDFLLDRYRFRYNIVSSRQEYSEVHSKNWCQLSDRAENSMVRELQKAHLKVSNVMLRTILASDFCPLFDPFESYFKSLPSWDTEIDFITELASTVKTTDQEQWLFCFKRWFVAMVAGVLDDRIVNHTLIVLSGGQGLGKTTWVQNLIPKPLRNYIFSGEIRPGNKDAMQQISENMLINLDELENLNRSEIGALKEIVTKSEIKVRKAYGHHHEKMPRRASFAGSVNNTQFLNDTTGSRRFLCFEVMDIDYKHKIDLDKVYAQAYYLFKNGFRFWFDKEEIKQISASNERFQMRSAEEELLLTWFDLPDETKTKVFLTTSQIASKLASQAKINVSDASIKKLGSALRKHGFERVKQKNVYGYLVQELSWDEVEQKSKAIQAKEAKVEIQELIQPSITLELPLD